MSTGKLRVAQAILALAMASVQALGQQAAHVEHALVDPATQTKWVLQADSQHPGGPGRLVPLHSASALVASEASNSGRAHSVIRAGDRLIVEETTQMLVARYAAVALAPAAIGDTLLARFAVGMKPVPVRALGPGRASLLAAFSASEAQQ
ncbi:MAG TPA: hypothetical protein VN151_05095 [Terracidiphilus sp.]|nr:hypothetical protein [Terracidiphilus sp.]